VTRSSLAIGPGLALALALAVAAAAAGCADPPVDGRGAVRVLAPNGDVTLVAGELAVVRWQRGSDAAGAAMTVELLDDAGAVAMVIAPAIEDVDELSWYPPGVAAASAFRVRVVARSGTEAVGEDSSDAAFTIAPPAGLSFARDVQPIFTARCTTQFCHGHESQVALLDLSAGRSHAALVEVPSATAACRAFVRVRAGMPEASYLLWKLTGSGTCLAGVRMPKDAAALGAAELSTIRGWISEGARAN
jgi:hypothetical protein